MQHKNGPSVKWLPLRNLADYRRNTKLLLVIPVQAIDWLPLSLNKLLLWGVLHDIGAAAACSSRIRHLLHLSCQPMQTENPKKSTMKALP